MKNTKAYNILIGLIPIIQVILDTLNTAELSDKVRMIVGATAMLLLIVLQGVQRYLNPEIKNTTLWISVVAFVGFVAGGILDNLNVVNLTENAESIIRLVFTIIVVVSSSISKEFGYNEKIEVDNKEDNLGADRPDNPSFP